MPSKSYRNNNPGNIEAGKYSKWIDSKSTTDGRYAVFSNVMMGVSALARLLGGGAFAHLTLSQAISKYAPSEDHNPTNEYINFLSKEASIPVTQTLDSLSFEQCILLLVAMTKFEGWEK